MIRVFHDHTVIATHPDESKLVPQANGDLLIIEPGQVTGTTYVAGTFHGAGPAPCYYMTPNLSCPNCFRPAPAPVPVTPPPSAGP